MSISLSPGVFTFEHPSGLSVVRGAISNRLLAIGMAQRGPIGEPVQVLSYDQFVDVFGDDLNYGELGLQMRQFFTAGGSDAVVVRAAQGAVSADITLSDAFGDVCLILTAVGEGAHGNQLRAIVDYDTAKPEETFNLTVYREVTDSLGRLSREAEERFTNLSMDPLDGRFVENAVNGVSAHVVVETNHAAVDLNADNASVTYSQSAFIVSPAGQVNTLINNLTGTSLICEINGQASAPIDISAATDAASLASEIQTALQAQGHLNISITGTAETAGALTREVLRLSADANGLRSFKILPAMSNDASAALGLGTLNGGVEINVYSRFRPAMNGITSRIFTAPGDLSNFLSLSGTGGGNARTWQFQDGSLNENATWGVVGSANYWEGDATADRSTLNFKQQLDTLVSALNSNPNLEDVWTFDRIGLRLRGLRNDGALAQSNAANLTFQAGTNLDDEAVRASYALAQDGGAVGIDGNAPELANYQDIFTTVSREVDIFNMMILPRGDGQNDTARSAIWGAASSFCRDENALLIVDPHSDNNAWSTVFEVTDDADLTSFKSGILPEVSCTFWPRVRTPLGTAQVHIDPAGTMAGIMASTIARAGVWNTAAGLSAPLVGVTGLEHAMSDAENGVINPRGINALRAKSTGNVSWGGRTLAGDDAFSNRDFAYISVRMTTDFVKNSISRALESFVFKNNNQDTWTQIEMMCKSFMHGLYKKGAFRGTTADQAYEVRCNALTTTPTDIQLGQMNVWVMFAPQFPAEFIHLHIQHKFEQPSI